MTSVGPDPAHVAEEIDILIKRRDAARDAIPRYNARLATIAETLFGPQGQV